MTVVADTSPLNYLVLIGEVELLARFSARVLIPDTVAAELRHPRAPLPVLEWAAKLPPWIEIREAPSERLARLHGGESAAILLAAVQRAPVLLLIDDRDACAEAERRRIPTLGTLGLLRAAALRGLVDLPAALNRLTRTNFRCSAELIGELIEEDRQRKAGQ